jgi:hypothetical protein
VGTTITTTTTVTTATTTVTTTVGIVLGTTTTAGTVVPGTAVVGVRDGTVLHRGETRTAVIETVDIVLDNATLAIRKA